MKQEIFVEGMKCEGCANTVKEKFETVQGVDAVSMDLENEKAVVTGEEKLDTASFADALSDTNYSVVE